MDINEEIKLKVGMDRLLTALTQGGALSDIQRMANQIAINVGWPFYNADELDSDAEARTVGMEGEE